MGEPRLVNPSREALLLELGTLRSQLRAAEEEAASRPGGGSGTASASPVISRESDCRSIGGGPRVTMGAAGDRNVPGNVYFFV